MKLCDRCRASDCLLNYGGKACQEARKRECPDVVFTRADKIRNMTDEELAENLTFCPADESGRCRRPTCAECRLEWLQEPAEVIK